MNTIDEMLVNEFRSFMEETAWKETTEVEVTEIVEEITLIDHSAPLAVGAQVGEVLFNELKNRPMKFGLPVKLINGEIHRQELALLVELLPMVVANGYSTTPWLASRCENIGLADPMKVAEAVTKFLTEHEIIEKRPIIEWADINGAPVQTKRWLLTDRIYKLREELGDNTQVTICDMASEKPLSRIRGGSTLSELTKDALDKQDNTALRFHPLTMGIVKAFKADARNGESIRKEESLVRELKALETTFRTRTLLPFYLTHTCDYRGRMYARGGFISTQGGKHMKLAITFAEPVQLSGRGEDELSVYIAREFLGHKGNWKSAKAAGEAERANPTTLGTKILLTDRERVIVRLDGCSNGIQWMSALLNDREGCTLTNLTGTSVKDLYTHVADTLGLTAGWITERVEVEGLVRYERKHVSARGKAKALVMPYSYGASIASLARNLGVKNKVIEHYLDILNKILPIKQYLNVLKTGMEDIATPDLMAMDLDAILNNEIVEDVLPEAFDWELPDGFKVHHETFTYDLHRGLGGNYAFRDLDSKRLDSEAMVRALAPNIVHSLDALHARLVVLEAPFPVVAIHDSFGCHAENVPALRKIILSTFQSIIAKDPLNKILKSLGMPETVKPIPTRELSNPYAFM